MAITVEKTSLGYCRDLDSTVLTFELTGKFQLKSIQSSGMIRAEGQFNTFFFFQLYLVQFFRVVEIVMVNKKKLIVECSRQHFGWKSQDFFLLMSLYNDYCWNVSIRLKNILPYSRYWHDQFSERCKLIPWPGTNRFVASRVQINPANEKISLNFVSTFPSCVFFKWKFPSDW